MAAFKRPPFQWANLKLHLARGYVREANTVDRGARSATTTASVRDDDGKIADVRWSARTQSAFAENLDGFDARVDRSGHSGDRNLPAGAVLVEAAWLTAQAVLPASTVNTVPVTFLAPGPRR